MKNLSKKLFFLFTLIIGSIHLMNAQNHIIKGIVTSNQNEPLIGVTVMVKSNNSDHTNGTVTNMDGEFSLNASPDASLVFSYVGYKSKTIAVRNQTFLSVRLEEDAETLDEVVVVGYGTVKKSDLTGAVSSVKASDISNTAAAGIEVALQGKVPGVFIAKKSGKPGETADIKIRGGRVFQQFRTALDH